jgi:hypothetical protein
MASPTTITTKLSSFRTHSKNPLHAIAFFFPSNPDGEAHQSIARKEKKKDWGFGGKVAALIDPSGSWSRANRGGTVRDWELWFLAIGRWGVVRFFFSRKLGAPNYGLSFHL